ncbi:MAG TPA: hypothetical protein VF461_15025 [Gemmatimonadaceae bacterium]
MAEIPIRRKEGRNVWPLLLGLLVLAAVLWFVVVRHPMTTATATRPDSAAIRDSIRLRADSVAAAQARVTTGTAGGALGKMDTSKLGKMDTAKLNATQRKATTAKKKGY